MVAQQLGVHKQSISVISNTNAHGTHIHSCTSCTSSSCCATSMQMTNDFQFVVPHYQTGKGVARQHDAAGSLQGATTRDKLSTCPLSGQSFSLGQ